MSTASPESRFAVCLAEQDCADLEKGKVYVVLTDAAAERDGYLRVVDESGEDYLYPESLFAFVDLPWEAKKALLAE